MSGIAINDADITRLERQLRATPSLLDHVSANLAEESINLVREGFDGSHDPYGAAWQPRKSDGGGRALLVRTGAMRNSVNVAYAHRRGFGIRAGVGYATYHQQGTGRMPARKIMPDQGTLPAGWRARYDEVVDEVFDAHFRR